MFRTRDQKMMPGTEPIPFRAHGRRDLERIPQMQRLGHGQKLAIRAVSSVLPFRVNRYVVDELIDWDRVPHDPIFQLTFPQEGMLPAEDFRRVRDLLHRGAPEAEVNSVAREIRRSLNPHPSGQRELNVPQFRGRPLRGVQHKYRQTVLFFPAQGQTCHAYCTYCFRWAQFVGPRDSRFATLETGPLVGYLGEHPEVTDVLVTGGDPLIMRTAVLRRMIEPLLEARPPSLSTIRIGTKALAYWPYRFLTDPDADDLLRLFENVQAHGIHLALMAHYSHPREMETAAARSALGRVLSTGAVVRCQAPLIRRVNDHPAVWGRMWSLQVRLGAVPYYMFVERDTGPRDYFEVPLSRALTIFQQAYERVSGLGRTVRGPSMSATPGKAVLEGRARVAGEDVFVLKFIQARDPSWTERTFFARYDPQATWLDELRPAFGEREFFFEPALRGMRMRAGDLAPEDSALTGT